MNTPNDQVGAGAPAPDPVSLRLRDACAGMTCATLARLTRHHPEVVRCYLRGMEPSAAFLARVCEMLNVNGDWLLAGRGSPREDPGSGRGAGEPPPIAGDPGSLTPPCSTPRP